MFECKFETDNAAFAEPHGKDEIVRILHELVDSIEAGKTDGRVMDLNGNGVGQWHYDAPETIDAAYNRVDAALPDSIDLHMLGSYDDVLRDDQVAKILAGQADDVYEQIEEFNTDNSYRDSMEWLKEHLEPEDYELLDGNNRLDDLRLSVQERAEKSYYDLLRAATGPKLFLYRLNHDVPELGFDAEDDITEAARDVAAVTGIDFDANRESLTTLVTEGQGGGLYVIWHGDSERVMDAAELANREDVTDAGTISWAEPRLLVFDAFNGHGYDVKVAGTVTVPLEAKFRLDGTSSREVAQVQGGTTWHDVAGLVFRAYESEPVVTMYVCKHCHWLIGKVDDGYVHRTVDTVSGNTVVTKDGYKICHVQAIDPVTGMRTSEYIDDPAGNLAEPITFE